VGEILIDLHIHTKYSDGTFTVEDILKEAERRSITTISITDHNTIEAYKHINGINSKQLYRGNIIVGTEINCVFQDFRIELLGYNFSNFDFLENWLKLNYSNEKEVIFRTSEYEKLLQKMKVNNMINNCPTQYDPKGNLPHTLIYNELKSNELNKIYLSKGEWDDFSLFFRTATIDKNSLFYIDYSDILPSAKEVSKTIKESGGKVFLAHVFSYNMDNHIGFIDDLVRSEIIDGIETFYSTFSKEQSKKLHEYCKKNNLYMSGGSDFHGINGKEYIDLGIGLGNLDVPDYILREWCNY
jgi:3',5'-nucleoside bisphosphate phosphatase